MSALLTILALCIVAQLRNTVAYRIVNKRIDEIHAWNLAAIQVGQETMSYDDINYGAIMFDPFVWTLRQAFPPLPGDTHAEDAV